MVGEYLIERLRAEDWMRLVTSLALSARFAQAFGTTLEAMQDRADVFWRTQIKNMAVFPGTGNEKQVSVSYGAAAATDDHVWLWGCGYAPPHAGRAWVGTGPSNDGLGRTIRACLSRQARGEFS